MSSSRLALGAAIAVLVLFIVVVAVGMLHSTNGSYGGYAGALLLVAVGLVGLITLGSRLYGSNSHYGRAAARNRAAQDAHDLAIDEARASAQGLRYDTGTDPRGPETETPA